MLMTGNIQNKGNYLAFDFLLVFIYQSSAQDGWLNLFLHIVLLMAELVMPVHATALEMSLEALPLSSSQRLLDSTI